jgi:hypothetical protein
MSGRTRLLCGVVAIVVATISFGTWRLGERGGSPQREASRSGPEIDGLRATHAMLCERATNAWNSGSAAQNTQDLAEVARAVVDVWGDALTVDEYVDVLVTRAAHVNEQAVELANQRRSRYPDQFPSDTEWEAATPEERVRAYLQFAWADHAPVASFDPESVEAWEGPERGTPAGCTGVQGMLARFLPPGMTLADVQNADKVAWLRVRARMHGYAGEHVIDFRFVLEPKGKRWFPAEVRVYGETTGFRWGL